MNWRYPTCCPLVRFSKEASKMLRARRAMRAMRMVKFAHIITYMAFACQPQGNHAGLTTFGKRTASRPGPCARQARQRLARKNGTMTIVHNIEHGRRGFAWGTCCLSVSLSVLPNHLNGRPCCSSPGRPPRDIYVSLSS